MSRLLAGFLVLSFGCGLAFVPSPAWGNECTMDDVLELALSLARPDGALPLAPASTQREAPTTSGASSALVDSPQKTRLLAAALQQGLVSTGSSGAITMSLAPFAWLSASKPPGYTDDQDVYDAYDSSRRLTGSLTLGGRGDGVDTNGDGQLEEPVDARSLADSVAVELEYRFLGSRDRRDYSIAGILSDAANRLSNALLTYPFGDEIVQFFETNQSPTEKACSAFAKRIAERSDFRDYAARDRDFSAAFSKLEKRIDTSLTMSIAATAVHRKDYLGSDKYGVALRALQGVDSGRYWKFNLDFGRIEHAGAAGRSIDSVKLAAEYSKPVLQGIDLGGGQPTFSVALTAEKYRHVLAPAPTSVATLGMKWVFPIAKGVSIPFSISWANHTALLKDADEVYGHVGITLDMDQLGKL